MFGACCTTGILGSAMCAIDTAKVLLDTADSVPCTHTRQRGHDSDNDSIDCLPCAHVTRTRRRVCRVSTGTHGTKKRLSRLPRASGGDTICRVSENTRQRVCRVPRSAVCLALTARPRVDQRRGGSHSLPCASFAVCATGLPCVYARENDHLVQKWTPRSMGSKGLSMLTTRFSPV
jgi:hypothetical protein